MNKYKYTHTTYADTKNGKHIKCRENEGFKRNYLPCRQLVLCLDAEQNSDAKYAGTTKQNEKNWREEKKINENAQHCIETMITEWNQTLN